MSVLQRSVMEGALLGWLMRRPPSVARVPVELLSAEEVAGELQRVQARKAMDAAYEAELVMALAAARPDTDDPPPGHPGARRRGGGSPVPGTSEFLPDELAIEAATEVGVDGVVEGGSATVGGLAGSLRKVQNGFVRSYALSLLAGVLLVVLTLLAVNFA